MKNLGQRRKHDFPALVMQPEAQINLFVVNKEAGVHSACPGKGLGADKQSAAAYGRYYNNLPATAFPVAKEETLESLWQQDRFDFWQEIEKLLGDCWLAEDGLLRLSVEGGQLCSNDGYFRVTFCHLN